MNKCRFFRLLSLEYWRKELEVRSEAYLAWCMVPERVEEGDFGDFGGAGWADKA